MAKLSNIKIVMVAPCQGNFGGIETFCLALIEDLIKKGASVCLLRKKVLGFYDNRSIQKNEDEICSTWIDSERKCFSSKFVSPRASEIKDSIRKSDLVHLHNPVVEGVWYAKKFRKPCVMTIYNWKRRGIHPRLFAWKWAVKNADRRWYISEYVWKSWEKVRRKGSARLPVISKMPVGQCPINQRKGFLFIGRFIPNKGIRVLLNAYNRISPDPELWPLTLVGDGPLRIEVEKIISLKNIQGVKLTGFVSEADRQKYTRESKWMVTPPHTKEDLGLTPLEARSVSVPCIATTDGGIPETAGKHALFCAPGCVESLAKRLQEAVNMSMLEYEQKALSTKDDLQDYVRSLGEYTENYLQLLQKN